MIHDLEISIQEHLIKPSLIHEGGVSGHHVLDGHHSSRLRLVPVVDAGFGALLVHGLGTDGGFHSLMQFRCYCTVRIEKELFAIGGVEGPGINRSKESSVALRNRTPRRWSQGFGRYRSRSTQIDLRYAD